MYKKNSQRIPYDFFTFCFKETLKQFEAHFMHYDSYLEAKLNQGRVMGKFDNLKFKGSKK